MKGIYNKPEKPIIARRECVQINRRIFASTRGAASYWAWKRIAEKHSDCPIHNRESGYLSRLHKRYARILRRAFDEQIRMA